MATEMATEGVTLERTEYGHGRFLEIWHRSIPVTRIFRCSAFERQLSGSKTGNVRVYLLTLPCLFLYGVEKV